VCGDRRGRVNGKRESVEMRVSVVVMIVECEVKVFRERLVVVLILSKD